MEIWQIMFSAFTMLIILLIRDVLYNKTFDSEKQAH